MSLPEIDPNKVFSEIEYQAFRGIVNPEAWQKVWTALDIRRQCNGSHTSPYHDRYQKLVAVCGFTQAIQIRRKGGAEKADDMIMEYVARYPSSAAQLPSEQERSAG